MDLGVAFVAGPESSEVVQMCKAAFDDSALTAASGAVLGVASGDHGFDRARPQQPSVLVVVIAAVGDHALGPTAGPAGLAPHRRDGVQQRQQLGDVVAVAAGQTDGQRDAGRVDQQMVF